MLGDKLESLNKLVMSQLFARLKLLFAIFNEVLALTEDKLLLVVVIELYFILMNLVNIRIRILKIFLYLLGPFADVIFLPNQDLNFCVVEGVLDVAFLEEEFEAFLLHFDLS